MSPTKHVAVVGAGAVGTTAIKSLLSHDFTVTVLSRTSTPSKPIDPRATIIPVDYTSLSSLTQAFRGIDYVIVSLAPHLASPIHNLILSAAIAAGVKHFIPSEYGTLQQDPKASQMPVIRETMLMRQELFARAAKGEITYTIILCGGFLPWLFDRPLVLDWENRTAVLVDGGEQQLAASKLSTVGEVIARVFAAPEKFRNREVRIQDTKVSKRQWLEWAREAEPEMGWTEVHVDSKEAVEKAMGFREGVKPEEMMGILGTAMWSREFKLWFEDDMEELGLEGVGDDVVREWVRKKVKGEKFEI